MKATSGLLLSLVFAVMRLRDTVKWHFLRRRYPKWATSFLTVHAVERLSERVGYPHAEGSHTPEFQAWTLSWLIESEQALLVTELLSHLGYAKERVDSEPGTGLWSKKSLHKLCAETEHQAGCDESLASCQTPTVYLCQHAAFSGVMVTVVTNDGLCIERIQSESRWLAPMPMDAFPQLNPDEFGALQGELAYWWEFFWRPFWISRTEEQRRALSKKLSQPWLDFIADRVV